jgi:hypothetical protein
MMRRVGFLFALSLVAACPGKHAAPASAALPSAPNRVLGIVLRQPLNPAAVLGQRCFTGRQFALEDGFYDIVTDDILFSVPSEHQDTAAVLAALDSFPACRVRTRELNATAIVTLSDSVVGHALIDWPGGGAPTYESMVRALTQTFGEPFQSAWGVPYWSADSMAIHVNKRGPYGDGTTLTLSDARVCERYERLVHRGDRRPHEPCWKEPKRLDPAEVFTDPPVALADSDLIVSRLTSGADSALVRRTLGAPAATDSLSWTYAGLRIWFRAGRVTVIEMNTPAHATARGLRVGDQLARAKALYGTPCIRELWIYCRTVTSEAEGRGMLLEVKDHVITTIRVGVVFHSVDPP